MYERLSKIDIYNIHYQEFDNTAVVILINRLAQIKHKCIQANEAPFMNKGPLWLDLNFETNTTKSEVHKAA